MSIRTAMCRLWDAAQRGDWVAAKKEQERLCRLFEIVWVAQGRVSGGASGIGAFKTAMRSLGIIDSAVDAAAARCPRTMPKPRGSTKSCAQPAY